MNMIKRVIIKAEGVAIMANTSINIRMDADLKRQFEAFCADMGTDDDNGVQCFCA